MVVSLLRLMMAIGGGITILLALLAYGELLPPQYAVYALAVTAFLKPLLDGIVAAGDLLDDGVRNNSFSVGSKNPSVLRQWLVVPLMLGAVCLTSCETAKMSDTQIWLAQQAVSGAQVGVIVAESQLAKKMSDPATPVWQVELSRRAVENAKKLLLREENRLQQALDARDVQRLPSVSGKAVVDLAARDSGSRVQPDAGS